LRKFSPLVELRGQMNITQPKAIRVMTILQHLVKGHRLEPEKIASDLNTTSRTIRNDIETLVNAQWLTTAGETNAREYTLTSKGREIADQF
jgi:predicted transcriptional regulator